MSASSSSTRSRAARRRASPTPPGWRIASACRCNMCAKQAKGFGRNSQIEGEIKEGQRVLLVEDLTTDGGSKVNFINALRKAGARCDHTFVIFYYDIFPEGLTLLEESRRHASRARDVVGRARRRQEERKFRREPSSKRSRPSCAIRAAGPKPMAEPRGRANERLRRHRRRRRQRRLLRGARRAREGRLRADARSRAR